MSLNRSCDRCGRLVDDNPDKEMFDFEVYMGGSDEPVFAAEDLCPSCMEFMRNQVETVLSRKLDRESPTRQAAKTEKRAQPKKDGKDGAED